MILAAQLVAAVWVLALILTVINLLDVPRLCAGDAPQATPSLSVIIPARDEAAHIAATVRGFLAQDYPRLEVIVVDDRSSDDTAAAARAAGDQRARVIDGAETPAGWLGKPWAMQQGYRAATGELLLFADADVRYAPAAVRAMVAFRERTGADLVTVLPRVEMRGFWEHALMPQLACFLFRSLPIPLANRTSLPVLAAGGGIGNLVTRDAYERAGTHEALRDAVIDDVGLARLIRRRGGHTRVGLADSLISIRVYHGLGAILRGFTKNMFPLFGWLGAVLLTTSWTLVHLAPHVVAVAGPAALQPWALGAVGLIALNRVILFGALGYRLDMALVGEVPMTLGWMAILARSTWQVGVRRRLVWRGRRYHTSRRFGEAE